MNFKVGLVCAGAAAAGVVWAEVFHGGNFNNAENWENGEIAPNAPGSTVVMKPKSGSFTSGSFSVSGYAGGWTLGHLLVPAEAPVNLPANMYPRETLVSFDSPILATGSATKDPDFVVGNGVNAVSTNSLAMNSGQEGVAASIKVESDISGAPLRMVVAQPLVLESDLHLHYRGGTDKAHCNNPSFGLSVAGDVSERGGKRGVRVTSDSPYGRVALGGDNTFSGDVDVQSGTLMALNRLGCTTGAEFGRDNTVHATNGVGRVDIGGGTFWQRLVLGGAPETDYCGVLYNSRGAPDGVYGKWAGEVTLKGDVKVGGWDLAGYPGGVGGNLEISGPVKDAEEGAKLIIDAKREVRLSGDNEISGGIELKRGVLSAAKMESLGTGPLVWRGNLAAYRMRSADDPDISLKDVVATNAAISLLLDGDFEYAPARSFSRLHNVRGIAKTGRGTLRLTQENKMMPPTQETPLPDGYIWHDNLRLDAGLSVGGGKVILDYTVTDGELTREGYHMYFAAEGMMLANDAEVEVITHRKVHHNTIVRVLDNALAKLTKRGEAGHVFTAFEVADTSLLMVDFEGGDVAVTSDLKPPEIHGVAVVGAEDGDLPGILYPGVISKGRTWITRDANKKAREFTAFSSVWESEHGNAVVDVTAENAGSAPANFSVSLLRFNTPAEGGVTLNLEGVNHVRGGTILVTEAMGSTPVTINGGSLRGAPGKGGTLRIVNLSKDCTVTVNSSIDPDESGETLGVAVIGCGKVVLNDNGFQGALSVVGAEVEISKPEGMGRAEVNGAKTLALTQGGTLTVNGEVNLVPEDAQGKPTRTMTFLFEGEKGGTINLPRETDKLLLNTTAAKNMSHFRRGGGVKIKGRGTVEVSRANSGSVFFGGWVDGERIAKFPSQECVKFTVEGATLVGDPLRIWDEKDMEMHVDGATLRGHRYLLGRLGGLNAGGNSVEASCRKNYVVGKGGVTFDIYATGNMGDDVRRVGSGWKYNWGLDHGLFHGDGEIRITNSLDNAKGISFGAFANRTYRGTIKMETVHLSEQGGPRMETALFDPNGLDHQFGCDAQWDPQLRTFVNYIGGIVGTSGSVTVKGRGWREDAVLHVGRDAEETLEYSGKLATQGSANPGGGTSCGRFAKVGSNDWKVSGTENDIRVPVTVRAGGLVMGNAGALSAAKVHVGDEKTKAGDRPALKAGAGVRVENEVRVYPVAAGATPSVGGEAGGEIAGPVKVYGDVLGLWAGEGEATVSGAVTSERGEKVKLVKWGPGKVRLTAEALGGGAELALAGCEGGTVEFDGPVAIAEGATINLDGLPEGFFGDRKNKWTILEAKGGISGQFAPLPDGALPGTWSVVYRHNRVTLGYPDGFTIIVR